MKLKKDIFPAMEGFFNTGGFPIKRYHRDISMAKDRILESSQVVKTSQGFIEYSTFGSGLPVLFIHGAGGGHDMGRVFSKLIGDDFFWICPSRFGYLRTPIPQDASFESQLVEYDFATYTHAHIPNSELIPFPSGGHMLLGQHKKYRQVLANFLKENL